jgi:hypothetical protein
MKDTLRQKLTPLPIGVLGFVFGSALIGVAIAQPTPAPPPSFTVREQNLDANGFIRVHEQGVLSTVANISNFPTSFSVNNFPETQNVKITGGELQAKAPPVTTGISARMSAEPNEVITFILPATINATTISIGKGDHEAGVYFKSPMSVDGPGAAVGPTVFHVVDLQGRVPFANHSFTRPVPINAVVLHCRNEAQTCFVDFDILGDPGGV